MWEKTGNKSWFLDIDDENHTFAMISIKDNLYFWRVFSDSCMRIQGIVSSHDHGYSQSLCEAQNYCEKTINKIIGDV